MFLRPLPGVANVDRLISVNFGTPRGERGGYTVSFISSHHADLMASSSPSILGMAGWQPGGFAIAVPGEAARETRGEFVSASYFDVMGVRIAAGRIFLPEEHQRATGEIVAIASATLSARLFGAESPIGRRVALNGSTVTIIGVAPSSFGGINRTQPVEIWLPGVFSRRLAHFPLDQWTEPPDRGPFYMFVARLAPGATRERADVELTRAALALSTKEPAARKFESVRPLIQDQLPGPARSFRTVFAVLFGAGVLLVLLGAANLANLFVFRAIRRGQESAIRRALGASAGRLARLQLAEALLVALPGAGLGIVAAFFLKTWIGQALFVGRLEPVLPIDWRLAVLTLGTAALVAAVLGILPARLATRIEVAGVLGRSGRAVTNKGAKLRTTLAAAQLVLSLTLLIGALLFTTTLRNIRGIDLGFNPTNVFVLDPEFRTQGYRSARVTDYYRELLPRVQRLPGVLAAAVGDGTPLAGGGVNSTVIPAGQGKDQEIRAFHAFVTPRYFEVLGIQFLSGRPFEDRETLVDVAEHSVVVSESLARRLFGEAQAVGRTVLIPEYKQTPHEVQVVGVARDVRLRDVFEEPGDVVYRPARDNGGINNWLLVRWREGAANVPNLVRQAATAVDPALPLNGFTMQEIVNREMGPQRLFAWASSALSILGFVLAAVGVYGLVSQTVVERTREFGIRLAIGAGRWQIVRLVVRSAVVVAAIGAPLGVILAAISSRFVENSLFGVTTPDPSMYALAVTALVGVVITASAIPAWFGSRVNPVDVMRAE
jgi:predicted permease